MKMVKSLLLVSAAGLVAVSGAQAADLPVKAKPVEYVKVCSLYGAGFYYIPGTDICMKVGGYVRYQVNYGTGNSISGGPFNGTGGLNDRVTRVDVAQRTRAVATFDTRQQTAYGTLRTYLLMGFQQDSTAVPATSPSVYMTRGFIQIAGFTFGKATSFFDFFAAAAVAYNAGFISSPDTGDAGAMVGAYTAQFGNGVSATLAIEQSRRNATAYVPGVGAVAYTFAAVTNNNLGSNNTAGVASFPDIVGNLRIDQAWGSAQVSAAAHDVSASYYGTAPLTDNGHPDNKWGWAVSGGLRLNAPMIGPGDYFQGAVVYSQGATRYASVTPGGANNYYFDGNNVGFGFYDDANFGGTQAGGAFGNQINLTTAWSVAASYEHFWTPSLRTSVYGSYIDVSRNTNGNALACAGFGFNVAAVQCDMNFSVWNIGSRSQWNITKDLYVGLDVIYQKINSATINNGAAIGLGAPGRSSGRDLLHVGPGCRHGDLACSSRHRSLMIA